MVSGPEKPGPLFHDKMKLLIDISILLNAIGAVQGFTLAFIYFRKKSNQYANRILAVVLLAFSLIIFNTVIILTGYNSQFTFYQDISNVSLLVITPLLYAYVRLLAGSRVASIKVKYHLIPFFIYASILLIFYLLPIISTSMKDGIDAVYFVIFNVQVVSYLYLSFRCISTHDSGAKESFSNLQDIGLGWIKVILSSFAVAFLMHTAVLILIINGVDVPQHIRLNVTLLWAAHIFLIGYRSLRHDRPVEVESVPKYLSSTLPPEKTKDVLSKLEQVMVDEKLYLNPNLTIAELAKTTGFQSRHISQVVNQELERNFYDFVNFYRVQEVKAKLRVPEFSHLTILGIAKECGFQSGSAFNAAFKKFVGKSPSAFRKGVSE